MNNKYNALSLCGKIFTFIGLGFFIIGLVFISLSSASELFNEINLVGIIFFINGILFNISGVILLAIDAKQKERIKRLTGNGFCYDCKIVKVYENIHVRINYRCPIIVECVYTDKQGKNCLVKSKNVWLNNPLTNKDDLKAKVWVNPDDGRDYYVEVYTDSELSGSDVKYDVDYR